MVADTGVLPFIVISCWILGLHFFQPGLLLVLGWHGSFPLAALRTWDFSKPADFSKQLPYVIISDGSNRLSGRSKEASPAVWFMTQSKDWGEFVGTGRCRGVCINVRPVEWLLELFTQTYDASGHVTLIHQIESVAWCAFCSNYVTAAESNLRWLLNCFLNGR